MKEAFFGGLLVLIGIAGGALLIAPALQKDEQPPLGANAGPDYYNQQYFHAAATIGGNVFATTSQGSVTYTAASLTDVTVIQHTASGALTATLPASSTLTNFIPRAGDTRTIFFAPITTNITLAGGTGTDLNTASTTKVCGQGNVCRLDFVRKQNSDIEVLLSNS